MKNCAATLKWNNNFANLSATTFLPYPRVRDISPRPRGCKNYPELPCELTEKLTETAVRAQFLQIEIDSPYRYYTNISHSLYAGGPINASSGLGQNPAGATITLQDVQSVTLFL